MARQALGREVVEGEVAPCVVPGHGGGGWVERKRDGRLVYRCACDKIERPLTDAYVGRVTGAKYRRAKSIFVLWKLRLAARAGLVELPPAPPIPPLPDRASKAARAVHAGLALFLRARLLTDQRDEPDFTFTRGFATEWSGVTCDQARDGIEALVRFGVLVRVGKRRVGVEGEREAVVYRIGGSA